MNNEFIEQLTSLNNECFEYLLCNSKTNEENIKVEH